MVAQGIEGADLKAIQVEAGQRNKSAVNYYFGGREGLVEAIGIRHRPPIDQRRMRILDRLTAAGSIDLGSLAAALVEPLSACLADESGRRYVIILAESMTRYGTAFLIDAPGIPYADSMRRLNQMVLAELGPGADARRRMGNALLVTVTLLADIARAVEAGDCSVREAKRRSRDTARLIEAILATPL
jgi:AcrR family transcriptional regulator